MASAVLRGRLLEPLLLRRSLLRQGSYTEEQRAVVSSYAQSARLWLEAESELSDSLYAGPSLLLLERAAQLALRSVIKAYEPSVDVGALLDDDAVSALERIQTRGALPVPPFDTTPLRELLARHDRLVPDEEKPDATQPRAAQLRAATKWFLSQVEPRSRANLLAQRILRLALVVVVVAVGLYALAVAIFTPPNLAGTKPVSMSSTFPGSPPPGALVNGTLEPTYGASTGQEAQAWVQVDLEQPYKIERVKVFNRNDAWFDSCLPLILEFSLDGSSWQQAGRRAEPFTQDSPWVHKSGASPQQARYIRLRTEGPGQIALTEIEVNGSR